MRSVWSRLRATLRKLAESWEIPMVKPTLEPYDEERDNWLLHNTTQAAHEPVAALRFFRRGMKGQALVDATRIKPTKLQEVLRQAMDDEGAAFARKVSIHDQPGSR